MSQGKGEQQIQQPVSKSGGATAFFCRALRNTQSSLHFCHDQILRAAVGKEILGHADGQFVSGIGETAGASEAVVSEGRGFFA